MKPYPLIPGVPAAGHVAANGFWHPGRPKGCPKCLPPQKPRTKASTPNRARSQSDHRAIPGQAEAGEYAFTLDRPEKLVPANEPEARDVA